MTLYPSRKKTVENIEKTFRKKRLSKARKETIAKAHKARLAQAQHLRWLAQQRLEEDSDNDQCLPNTNLIVASPNIPKPIPRAVTEFI